MTTVTLPRATVEQVLEALENGKRVRAGEGGTKFQIPLEDNAITALRAALAQQAELQTTHSSECWRWHHGCAIAEVERLRAALAQQAWVCPESPEHRYPKPGHCEDCGRTLVRAQQAERFCDTHCTWADHAPGCVRAEPVQEPVAWEGWWLHHGQHNYRAKPLTSERVKELMKLAFEVGRESAPPQRKPEPTALDWLHKWANQDDGEPETQWHEGYEAARRVVQIHLTAPPQRKPLTDEEIDRVWDQWFGAYGLRGSGGPYTRRGFARAVERAHGIKENAND